MAGLDDKDLQRYFDGELSAGKARRVSERIESDPDDRGRITALESMREAVRDTTQAAAEEADFGNLWVRVHAGIEREVPLGAGERLGFWLRRWGLALTAAAAAAVVAAVILVRSPADLPPPRNDVVIESLDVGAEAVGTIFTISDDVGDTGETTVIWVTETSAEGDD